MPARTFTTTIFQDDGTTMTGIKLPFDPKEVFGKVRAPVVVSVGAHEYRSTVFRMNGCDWVPLRRSHREAAGVKAGQRVRVTLASDDTPRVVKTPPDLGKALRAAGLLAVFQRMSYTHQREHVEAVLDAKKPETRERRIAACVAMVRAKAKPRRAAATD